MSFKLKDKKTIYGLMLASVLVAGFMTASFVSFNVNPENNGKEWHLMDVALAADADPGNGNDGVVNVYIYPLASKTDITGGTYACSEATAYEHGDADGFSDGEELQDSTPVGSTYIVAIEVQFSDKAYNTTSSDWDLDLVKAEITSSDLSLSAEVMEKGTDFFDQDGTSDAKLTFYVDNSDSGWTMTTGASLSVDDVDIYYYG